MKIPVTRRWAEFRFSVIGHLLASPPTERGALRPLLKALSERIWRNPVSGEAMTIGVSTIERWYYLAKRERKDTVGALGRKRRKDADQTKIVGDLKKMLESQYAVHTGWSAKLHADNLSAACRAQGVAGGVSYQTVRRYLRANGKIRVRRKKPTRPGETASIKMVEAREVRSFEVSHVGGLIHLDFHHARRQIVTAEGLWLTPMALAIIDDHSRLICHIQWYLSETAKDLVHGFSQAIMRRGLPRRLMTDNGAAMVSAEFTQGLARLGIVHETTLAYSPHQNGKMECFWGQLEGRLMAMLEGNHALDLDHLNRATLAWVEMEYHRAIHSETKQTPADRFGTSPTVMRPKPTSTELRHVFRAEEKRIQRRSDGTLTVQGVRYEIPDRYRHMREVFVRFARWDLTKVDLVCPKTGLLLTNLLPLDKTKNADQQRRARAEIESHSPDDQPPVSGPSPLLEELMTQYASSGLPPSYLPQT